MVELVDGGGKSFFVREGRVGAEIKPQAKE